MSEQENTETTVPESTEAVETPSEASGNKEAAKYRTQLREAEAARDAATAQVATLQNQIIESHLGHGLKPEAWRLAHPDTSDLINEDGSVNVESVKKAAQDARQLLGIPYGPIVKTVGDQPNIDNFGRGFEGAFAPKEHY